MEKRVIQTYAIHVDRGVLNGQFDPRKQREDENGNGNGTPVAPGDDDTVPRGQVGGTQTEYAALVNAAQTMERCDVHIFVGIRVDRHPNAGTYDLETVAFPETHTRDRMLCRRLKEQQP